MYKLILDNIQTMDIKRRPNRSSAMKTLNRFHEATAEMTLIGMSDPDDYEYIEAEYESAVKAMLETIVALTDKNNQILKE